MVSGNDEYAISGEGEEAPVMTGGKCGKKRKCKGRCKCKKMKGGDVSGYEELPAGAELEGGKKRRKGRRKMKGGDIIEFDNKDIKEALTDIEKEEYNTYIDEDIDELKGNAIKRFNALKNKIIDYKKNKPTAPNPDKEELYNRKKRIIQEKNKINKPQNGGHKGRKMKGGEGCDGTHESYDPAGVNAYDETAQTAEGVMLGGAKKRRKGRKKTQKGGVATVGEDMITGCIDRPSGGDPVPSNTNSSTSAPIEGGKGKKGGKKTYKIVEVDRNSKAVLKKLPMDKRIITSSGAYPAGSKAANRLFKVAPKSKSLIRFTIEDVDSGKQHAYVYENKGTKKVKIAGVERELNQYKGKSCNLSEVKA